MKPAKPSLGTIAPEMPLKVIGGQYTEETQIKFSDLKGKPVVLYFYPKDNTPGCTTQACALRDSWDTVKQQAVVLGVSPDSIRKHSNFISKFDLPFPLVSDDEKQLAEFFGVWLEKKMFGKAYMGVERSTFIFDASGQLHAILEKVKPADHVKLVAEQLSELK